MSGDLTALLLRETPDAIIITTPAGEVLYWNNGAEHILGYGSAEAVGKPLDDLIVPAEYVDQLNQFRHEAIANGFSTFETARRPKDGSLVYMVVSNKVVYDD